MLSDIDIKKALESKDIIIEPLDFKDIQPSSVDLRVGYDFRIFQNHKYTHIDPKAQQEELTTLVSASSDEPFILHPGEFVLGTTLEKVSLSNKVVARLEGKSSLGRIGLLIHSTAGFVDPGFEGFLTLELSNVANLPIKIYPEMKIGQISFYNLTTPSESSYGSELYGSKYQGQKGPTPSRSHNDFSN
jgi:dCTP deaminase